MTAQQAVEQATAWFDSGEFHRLLARRVAQRTESQRQDRDHELQRYLQDEIGPQLIALGFTLHFIENSEAAQRPFLVAVRIEDPALPTLLSYGHGDVVFGDDENWRAGLSPWQLVEEGDPVKTNLFVFSGSLESSSWYTLPFFKETPLHGVSV